MLEDAKFIEEEYEQAQNRTWGTGFSLAGTSYATSLFWQPLQNVDDPFADVQEASAGVLEGADLFCIKAGKAPQFGICVSSEGFAKGESVAAVSLASSLSNISSFIAVFKVEGGWWYTCVRNDIILSDGDMLFLSEEDAKNQFESMLAVPDWSKKIAPRDWGFPGTEEVDLGLLLSKGSKAKLQRIKGLRGAKLFFIFAISGILGFWILSSLFISIFLTPSSRPVIVPVAPKVVKPIERVPDKQPWEGVFDPSEVMTKCYVSTMSVVQLMPPGWQLEGLNCSKSSVSFSWKRNIGNISWLKKAVEMSDVPFSPIKFADNGESATSSVALGRMSLKSSPPAKTDADLKFELNDLFQSLGMKISLSNKTFTSIDKKVYKSIGFNFTSLQNPVVWQKMLTKFSGLVIDNITYNTTTKIWSYEGAIYAL